MSYSQNLKLKHSPNKINNHLVYDSELKEWFLDCVKTVKKEIAQRNHYSFNLELNKIENIREFLAIDKLRLLELFIHH
jgi:hypothetical protein